MKYLKELGQRVRVVRLEELVLVQTAAHLDQREVVLGLFGQLADGHVVPILAVGFLSLDLYTRLVWFLLTDG